MKFVINRTIGILFSTVKEYSFTQMLAELFQPLMQSPHLPVITFSLPNVDLTAKSVCGTCISGGKQEAVQADLPAIIFNFSFQYKKEGVRRLRALAESSTLLNATNRYHQLPVMEMLRCDEATKGYLLPFSAQDAAAFRRQGSRLLLPQSSASLSKITYCECTAGDCAIYTPFSSRSCTSAEATASLESISQSEQTLLLDAPKLQSGRKGLFTVRYFLQKRFDGSWGILTADTPRAAAQQGFESNEASGEAALRMITHIARFIPDLTIGFIDLAAGSDGRPYFLEFGGWDNRLMSARVRRHAGPELCANLQDYAESFFVS